MYHFLPGFLALVDACSRPVRRAAHEGNPAGGGGSILTAGFIDGTAGTIPKKAFTLPIVGWPVSTKTDVKIQRQPCEEFVQRRSVPVAKSVIEG